MLQAAERDAPASEPGKQEEIIRTTMNRMSYSMCNREQAQIG